MPACFYGCRPLGGWALLHEQRCSGCHNQVVTVGWGGILIILVALAGADLALAARVPRLLRFGLTAAAFVFAFALLPRWLPVRARRAVVDALRLR